MRYEFRTIAILRDEIETLRKRERAYRQELRRLRQFIQCVRHPAGVTREECAEQIARIDKALSRRKVKS